MVPVFLISRYVYSAIISWQFPHKHFLSTALALPALIVLRALANLLEKFLKSI